MNTIVDEFFANQFILSVNRRIGHQVIDGKG
jgi:hypothetical protein